MCTTCGCGSGETKIEGHAHEHRHADGRVHSHAHEHGHDHEHDHPHDDAHEHEHLHADGARHSHSHRHDGAHAHDHGHDALHYGQGPAHSHAPGLSQAQMVSIERGILDKNDAYARGNRRFLTEHGVLALNVVSSPGSGKTTLLVETIKRLAGELPVAVIEGDQQTSHDADRIRATGARAIQVNTGKGCHLDASMVEHALAHLELADDSALFIENVGNLVCPAAFDLGEAAKVVVLSVTEGEDKPLKYPDMFAAASLMLLNKVDLLPHLDFDVDQAIAFARRVNPQIEVLQISATKGEGMDAWLAWLRTRAAAARQARQDNVERLKRRVAELEVTIGRLSTQT